MNFDRVYEKYVNGTASEEEKLYIEEEIAKARKLSEIIDEMDAKRVIEPAKTEEVKKATRFMRKKFGIRVLVISISVLFILSLLTAGGLFAYVNGKASEKEKYTKEECIEFAKKSVHDHNESIGDSLIVTDVDKETRLHQGKLSKATYIYAIEVQKGSVEYDVEVNAATGEAVIVDVEK